MTDFSNWVTRPRPGLSPLVGRMTRLEPLDWQEHGEGLFAAVGGASNLDLWRYMPIGPFPDFIPFQAEFEAKRVAEGWETLVILDSAGTILGMVSFMRIREAHGSAEIGSVAFSDRLKRSTHATEAVALMARHLFDDLGYRRFEWKCHNRNEASKRAALRFGFSLEGVFRQDMVLKGENRDTAWFSMLDSEWPRIGAAFDAWLSPQNFDADGQQIRRLAEIRAAL